MSDEALKTSKIEGELLNRDSLQSSIRRNFGLDADNKKFLLLNKAYNQPLTQKHLFKWHEMLMRGRRDLLNVGDYRKDQEPMQVVSGTISRPKIHFEAPPSTEVTEQMKDFIAWFNETAPNKNTSLSALTRAGIAHLYFVCVHPFEDGNGRIARVLSEKALSQALKQPTLIALSHVIEKHRKA
jgi:Fic family protein